MAQFVLKQCGFSMLMVITDNSLVISSLGCKNGDDSGNELNIMVYDSIYVSIQIFFWLS